MVKFKNQWTGRSARLSPDRRAFNAVNSSVALRKAPLTLPRVSIQEKEIEPDEPPRICAGDIYRDQIYRREWFPAYKEHK